MNKLIIIFSFLISFQIVSAFGQNNAYEYDLAVKQMTMTRQGVRTFQVRFVFENSKYGDLIVTCDDVPPYRRTLEWRYLVDFLEDKNHKLGIEDNIGVEEPSQAEFYCFQMMGIAENFAPFPNANPEKEFIAVTVTNINSPLEIKLFVEDGNLYYLGLFSQNVHTFDGYKVYQF